MADIDEQEVWEDGVREVGQGEPVTGGPTGTVNQSLQDLANRTAWLKKQCEEQYSELTEILSQLDASALKIANNLSDVADAAEARKNLGIATLEETLQTIYPVGAIYISVSPTSPETLFGFGTWEEIRGRFIIGAGDGYSAEETGGEATHTLTVNEMPAHEHIATTTQSSEHTHTGTAASAGSHYHGAMGENSDTTSPYGIYESGNNHIGTDGSDWDNTIWRTSTDGAHTHTVTVNSGGAHTHSITVKSTGGGTAHNNIPPYFAAYIWRRTA